MSVKEIINGNNSEKSKKITVIGVCLSPIIVPGLKTLENKLLLDQISTQKILMIAGIGMLGLSIVGLTVVTLVESIKKC